MLAIALIGRTYHIRGDVADLWLTWAVLIIPVVYLADSWVVAFFYIVAVTCWAPCARDARWHAARFWLLATLVVPYVWWQARRRRYGLRTVLLCWTAAVCVTIGLGNVLAHDPQGLWIVAYSSLFGALYLVGALWSSEGPTFWHRPFHVAGAAGVGILAVILTFDGPWKDVGRGFAGAASLHFSAVADWATTGVLTAGALVLLSLALRRRGGGWLYGMAPLLGAAACAFVIWQAQWLPAVLVVYNLYLLALGVVTLISGMRSGALSTANGGLALMALLVVVRFFDADLSFVLRGVAFILVGTGFLVANLLMVRRWKKEAGR
jgi:hypothetical protein